MQTTNSEFSVHSSHNYDHRNALRWYFSHIWEHKTFLFITSGMFIITYFSFSYARVLIGDAADEILNPTGADGILKISLMVLGVLVLDGLSALAGSISTETLANRVERDARQELYTSLIGKSQTFHDQQRVGDIMARATDDVRQLNFTLSPGLLFMLDMVMGFVVPMLFIATINLELLIIPALFIAIYVVTVRNYIKKLDPIVQEQRGQYGILNAGLEETISGIEIVKVAVQEPFERKKFYKNANKFRDLFVQQGRTEALYLPLLFFGGAFGGVFFHTLTLYNRGVMDIPDIIAVMGLMGVMRFPVFISLFSLSLFQLGIASARRILTLINTETEIDENSAGYNKVVEGAVTFQNVTFGYDENPILEDITFTIQPGQTVAIVGQTGSGKSTLTQLVSRSYDVEKGSVSIDGVNVRDWSLDSLRSQISKIEQDVFLFSRTLGENIAFGAPNATREDIEHAAKEAQAHDFITGFKDGYETKVGERGVTLSGGQRQRIALARAFLKNPRILILDDSTSAIDSATEDQIQKAMRRAQEGRTTLLITHRLSQIRWADVILVLENGKLIASGSHEDLLRTSQHYRRIFARYDVPMPEASGTD